MTQQRQVAVIVGSLREGSFNRKIVRALEMLAPDHLVFEEIGIGDLPLYNQDLDGDPPTQWTAFRDAIRPKHALLFATPEYNRSIPGVLKNAIDVGSRPYGKSVWAKKPGAVISASIGTYGGFGANHHLRQSCVFLDVPLMPQPEAYLAQVKEEHFGPDGAVKDERMKKLLTAFVEAYADWIEKLIRGPGELADDAKR
jgi:chromate reductase, NAD(P)H dehydrogenase (quinone)